MMIDSDMQKFEANDLLRLVALDEDDLAVLSANLQDTLISVADITYLTKQKKFALAGRRFDWVKAKGGSCVRRAAGLHFACVLSVTRSGFRQEERDRVLNLLAINFEPDHNPAGVITLTFSGEAAIRLDVECIEAQMSDLGPSWSCDEQPNHALEPILQA